jgi:hypothetical protein
MLFPKTCSTPAWSRSAAQGACRSAMLKAKVWGVAALLATSAFVSSVSAAIVTVIYTDTVTTDIDLTGVFGTAEGINNLVGVKCTSKFLFDTSHGD